MSLTSEQQQDQVDDQLQNKLKIEASFLALLGGLFMKMGKDLKKSFLDNNTAISATNYTQDFSDFFNKIYSKTADVFEKTLDKQISQGSSISQVATAIGASEATVIDQLNDVSNIQIATFVAINAVLNANQVTTTNQKNIDTAFSNALAEAEKNDLTKEKTAELMQDKFVDLTTGRTGTILATSVQDASEGTKHIVAQQYNDLAVNADVDNVSFKIWNTILDNKERLSHAEADLQKQAIGDPYRVQQQSLQYPGDTSLGATMSNVANCRCTQTYEFK